MSPSFATLLIGMLVAGPTLAQNLYCCQDPSSGRRVCADTVPEACKGRSYKVIDRNGTVIREVGPPLTPEQKAELAAEAQRKKEQEALLREQQRRDAALLETYSNEEDIDRMLARAEEDIKKGMAQAEERIAEAQKRRKKFENEAEFYKHKELPTEVRRGLRNADDEIAAQKSLLDNKQKELEATRQKYAQDKKRYREVTSSGNRALHPAAAPTVQPALKK